MGIKFVSLSFGEEYKSLLDFDLTIQKLKTYKVT